MQSEQILYLIISLLLVILVSISGVFFVQKGLKKFLDKNLHYLVSFSAGVFCLLSLEMFHEAEHILNSFNYAILVFGLGFIGIMIATKFLPQLHEHHDSCCDHSHTDKIGAKKVLIGDAIHNVGDGIILATVFLASADLHVAIAVAVSVIIHEFLQEVSEFFVLKEAGFSTKKALFYNFMVSLTIVIGAIIGILFSKLNIVNGLILGITSGIFFNTVVVDLIPHNLKKKGDSKFVHGTFLLCGILFMFFILHLLEHSH